MTDDHFYRRASSQQIEGYESHSIRNFPTLPYEYGVNLRAGICRAKSSVDWLASGTWLLRYSGVRRRGNKSRSSVRTRNNSDFVFADKNHIARKKKVEKYLNWNLRNRYFGTHRDE